MIIGIIGPLSGGLRRRVVPGDHEIARGTARARDLNAPFAQLELAEGDELVTLLALDLHGASTCRNGIGVKMRTNTSSITTTRIRRPGVSASPDTGG